MLVSGLENTSLFKMISDDKSSYSLLYHSLYQCAQEILTKYQEKQECSKKQALKTQAVKVLLRTLGDTPEDSRTTHAIILSALKNHAYVLQGYEHLLSTKGNTYALIEQTKSLREEHGDAPASLLQYHYLKNKLLGPDTPLRDEQREIVSELIEKKGLTLEALEILKANPRAIARVLARLYKTGLLRPGLLEPNLCARVLGHRHPSGAISALMKLHQANLLKPNLCARVLERQYPFGVASALLKLHQANLLKSDLYDKVLEHENPDSAATALLELNKAASIKPNLCTIVLEQENPDRIAKVFVELIPCTDVEKSAVVIDSLFPSEEQKVEFLHELLSRKMASDIQGFCMALEIGNAGAIATFVQASAGIIATFPLPGRQKAELLYELLTSKRDDDIPGFFITLQEGHSDAITAFINESTAAIVALPLPEERKAELLRKLLASKTANDSPGFCMTLQCGHTKAITAFIQASMAAIAALLLPEKQKAEILCELLACKRGDGIPGFFVTLQNGHTDAIIAFIRASRAAFVALSLPGEQKAELLCKLLACKREDSVPGLLIALQKGHSKATTAFIQESAAAIAAISLPEERKVKLLCELLASKKIGGTPGFFIALEKGHPDAITAFVQASGAVIGALPLIEKRKAELLYELLACKRADGAPGLFMALQKGHFKAITAFIKASTAVIAALHLPDIQKVKLLYELLDSKRADDTPGFFIALQQGHSETITAFIQESAIAIAVYTLPKKQKAELLCRLLVSKAADGIPGFLVTLQNGHFDAITAFIQQGAAAMATFSDLEEYSSDLIYRLFYNIASDNEESFLLALEMGSRAMKKVFNEGINQLPLSTRQKTNIKKFNIRLR